MIALLTVLLVGCELPELPKAVGGTSVIDLDHVAKALGREAALREQIAAANQQLTGQVNDIASRLKQQLVDARGERGEKLTDQDELELRRLASAAQTKLRQTQAEARQRSQQFQATLINRFRAEVLPFAQRVAAERGSRVIVLKTNVLWYDPSADISAPVVEAMRLAAANAPAPIQSPGQSPGQPAGQAPSQAGTASAPAKAGSTK